MFLLIIDKYRLIKRKILFHYIYYKTTAFKNTFIALRSVQASVTMISSLNLRQLLYTRYPPHCCGMVMGAGEMIILPCPRVNSNGSKHVIVIYCDNSSLNQCSNLIQTNNILGYRHLFSNFLKSISVFF